MGYNTSRMATPPRHLLTAADVARCCRVDVKTIHNWAGRGQLDHFRTPGRHLRFQRPDVLDFLRRYGYPVPSWLLTGPPSVELLGPPHELEPLRTSLAVDFTPNLHSDPLLFLVHLGSSPPDAAVLVHNPSTRALALPELVRALRSHPGLQHTRVVTVGPPDTSGIDLGASAHLPALNALTLRRTLSALLGTPRITS